MENKICYLCYTKDFSIRPGRVRDNSTIKILECNKCRLVYLSTFNHIKERHYQKSGMHNFRKINFNEWLNATRTDDKRRYTYLKNKIKNKNILDFGCGIGGFLEFAKKKAKSIAGIELDESALFSLKKRKLKVYPSLTKIKKKKFDLITAFHVFEHLKDPKKILKLLSKKLTNDGQIIIEVPNSEDALLTLYENKKFQNFTYWSQHLYLFNSDTLRILANQCGLKIFSIKHIQRYSLSNHLYWLSKGKPDGQKIWTFMENIKLNKEYERQLSSIGKTDTIIASLSK